MIGRSSGRLWLCAVKTEPRQIQLIGKHVNDPDRVILSDVVVQMLGEQRTLRTIFAFDKSLHWPLSLLRRGKLYAIKIISVFTHPRPEGDSCERLLSSKKIANFPKNDGGTGAR